MVPAFRRIALSMWLLLSLLVLLAPPLLTSPAGKASRASQDGGAEELPLSERSEFGQRPEKGINAPSSEKRREPAGAAGRTASPAVLSFGYFDQPSAAVKRFFAQAKKSDSLDAKQRVKAVRLICPMRSEGKRCSARSTGGDIKSK